MIKRKSLAVMRSVATWSGVCVTLSGIGYNVSRGGDIVGAYISLVGVAITSIGHILGGAIARHDRREKESDKEMIEGLHYRVEEAESTLNAPYIKRLASEYADEHQDDGR